ncbi:FAD-binding oxidoreductase [Novosphingobium sp. PC22D]|uniref:FAD-binding oxidoreductase n=1 Tax=Novosphingobium sp. PC22D TaxID=1962403 RepID=UPI000BF241D5|nr:FAD-linked oxidase C-terminal domain-containing protein [Novosphingobium sp. PC22D]PEQ13777.1 FAD-binding oxidoreductase [Novosphingobium sp. PC22D]
MRQTDLLEPEDTALAALSDAFGDKLVLSEAARAQHAGLEGHHTGGLPDAVLMAASRDDVVAAVDLCARNGLAIVPHGAGTSLEGHLSAVRGGLSIDLTAMDRILEIDPQNMLCRVEPGVTREQLNLALRDHGLFFPIDPGANASLGGMAATRASGTNAVLYGTMRDNVLSLEVVTAQGRVIETGTRAKKSSAGYDLTGLFVGSEGTLGVITAVTLRLHGIPQAILAGTVAFDDISDAVRAVIQAIQFGLPVARIELLDEAQIRACNAFSKLDLAERPTLFLEFHGTDDGVAEQAALFGEIARELGGGELETALRTEDRTRLWKARHDAYFAAKALRPGAKVWTTDVCVPIASLAESIAATRADIDESGALATIVGHVGDGNYHVLFVLDPNAPEDRDVAAGINERMVARAIRLGGTCTGEHGVGIGKRQCLLDERGADAVALMATLKHALDPAGMFNPGKIFL